MDFESFTSSHHTNVGVRTVATILGTSLLLENKEAAKQKRKLIIVVVDVGSGGDDDGVATESTEFKYLSWKQLLLPCAK